MPIDHLFPQLKINDFSITSSVSHDYNCVAWAARETERWWWPDPSGASYWPTDVPRVETLDAFVRTFQVFGYEVCDSAVLERGFEKIAIFADPAGTPTHIARQLSSGRWTSKLGNLEDIEHDLRGLEGRSYGAVSQILRKPIQASQANL